MIRRLHEKHFDPVWHAHSEYQLFVVLKGSGTRFIGDSIHTFKPGELIFTGPHLPHLWRSDEIYFDKKSKLFTDGIVLYLNKNFLGEHILEKEEMIMIRKLFTRAERGVEFYGKKKEQIIRLMQSLTQMSGIESVLQLLKILNLMAISKDYHYISSKAYEYSFNQHETDRMNTVYEYVLKNFRQQIMLNDVADLLHMVPTSFSRYFTMKSNKPFSRFVSEIRVKHACKLLTDTDQSIETICFECGFNTPSNFNKQFKEIMQKSPTQYKKEFLSL